MAPQRRYLIVSLTMSNILLLVVINLRLQRLAFRRLLFGLQLHWLRLLDHGEVGLGIRRRVFYGHEHLLAFSSTREAEEDDSCEEQSQPYTKASA